MANEEVLAMIREERALNNSPSYTQQEGDKGNRLATGDLLLRTVLYRGKMEEKKTR